MVNDKNQYQIATGYATAGMMSGKFVSGILGQLVIYLNDNNYTVLIFYSLAGTVRTYIYHRHRMIQ